MRRVYLPISLAFALLLAPPSIAQTASDAPTDAEAVTAMMDVERKLLETDRRRYESLVRQRSDLVERMEQLHSSLDAAVRERETPDPHRMSQLAEQLQRAQADREALLATERATVERISQRLQRLRLFEEGLEQLRANDRGEPVGLSGVWDLTLMPTDQRGTCTLRQSGAVVNGTYELDGGWTGSLQGTLVNRKVFLVRIDSKLGKSMEFEGYLSADGKRIRGSWLSYELAGSDGSTGQWVARRSSDAR